MRIPGKRIASVRGALMNSDDRRAARRKRREAERERKKAARLAACTMEAVADLNALHRAAKQAARGVAWKSSVQRYQRNVLSNVARTRRDLLEGNDVCRGFIRFDIFERGKLRHISSVHFSERVAQKSLTQNALVPAIIPTLINANTANIKGKGTEYAIRLMKRDLARHWSRYASEGYILLVDFSDFFAKISHGPLKEQSTRSLSDPRVLALDHRFIDSQGSVGLGLGSEPNQIHAVAFPDRIDHFVTEMCGVEAYGRYMDDSYCIHESKEYLSVVLLLIRQQCSELGIVINEKKTRIVKLSRGFVFLKKRFFYADTGRIVVRPCRESITRERRKLKKQAALYNQGLMTLDQITRSYQSWRGGMLKLDAHHTVLSMDSLFADLFGANRT